MKVMSDEQHVELLRHLETAQAAMLGALTEFREALRPFTFPAHPDKFQSQDGGCTEALICDEDVKRARKFYEEIAPTN